MKRFVIIFIGLVLVLTGTLMIIKDAFGDSIRHTAEAVATNMVSSKINASLEDGFYNKELSEPLIFVQYNEKGDIQYLEPNSKLINRLLLNFSAKVKENYDPDEITKIKVNLGVVTGSRILSQLPFYFTVKVHPLSMTKFQYETEFETEGINQTRYFVYCVLTSEIHILAPFTDKTSKINRKILLAEAVIVGKVPDSYVMVPKDSILDAIE